MECQICAALREGEKYVSKALSLRDSKETTLYEKQEILQRYQAGFVASSPRLF